MNLTRRLERLEERVRPIREIRLLRMITARPIPGGYEVEELNLATGGSRWVPLPPPERPLRLDDERRCRSHCARRSWRCWPACSWPTSRSSRQGRRVARSRSFPLGDLTVASPRPPPDEAQCPPAGPRRPPARRSRRRARVAGGLAKIWERGVYPKVSDRLDSGGTAPAVQPRLEVGPTPVSAFALHHVRASPDTAQRSRRVASARYRSYRLRPPSACARTPLAQEARCKRLR